MTGAVCPEVRPRGLISLLRWHLDLASNSPELFPLTVTCFPFWPLPFYLHCPCRGQKNPFEGLDQTVYLSLRQSSNVTSVSRVTLSVPQSLVCSSGLPRGAFEQSQTLSSPHASLFVSCSPSESPGSYSAAASPQESPVSPGAVSIYVWF